MPGLQFDESFELPVEYEGGELLLPAKLVRRGYGYKIHVEVDSHEIIFEPDEERNWRAVMDNSPVAKNISLGIIQAIIEALEKHLR